MNRENLFKYITYYLQISDSIDLRKRVLAYKKGKITHILNPCRKCLVRPACTQHRICTKYQSWYFKEWFCDHNWKIDRILIFLPTSLMYQCTKCRKIK